MFGSQRIIGPLVLVVCLTQVSSVRFYKLPQTFKLTSDEVDHVTTNSVWTCFANAEAYDPEWTHFYFDASSSVCSLRGGLVSFDFTTWWPMGTPGAALPGNFYVKDVADLLTTVDGCPAETVLRDLVCALPEPLPPGQVDCSALESLVSITSANETALTNAFFRGKCSEYGRSLYSNTNPYRKSVVGLLWNETLSVAQRIEQAAAMLDSIGNDDDPTKEDLLAFPVGGWGTICDFLACAKLRFPSAAITSKKCGGSSATGTMARTVAASTSTAFTWTTVSSTKASSVATTPATTTKSSAATTRSTTTIPSTTTTPSTTTAPVRCGLCTFPGHYRILLNSPTTVPNVASIEACAKHASDKLPSGFVTYDLTAKTCMYGPTVTGFIYGNSSQRSACFQGKDLTPPTALNSTETELYIMEKVYGAKACPVNTTLSGSYCKTTVSTTKYGNYIAGRYVNDTVLVLTKTQVADSLNYYCDSVMSNKMIFGGTWWCYTRFDKIASPGYSTISTNKCATLQAGSTVIKFSEPADKSRECGYLVGTFNQNRFGFDVFLGLILPSGVAKTATAYKYYDGALPGALPWGTGYPNATDKTKNLVICYNVGVGNVRDVTSATLKSLFCKKAATRSTTTTPTSG